MSLKESRFYEFGPYRLDIAERRLLRGDQPLPLTPKAFETLLALVENAGRTLEKDELLQRVWPDTFVEEVSLARNISVLRKALEDQDGSHIKTIPKRGYRFVSPVRKLPLPGVRVVVDEHTLTQVLIEETETKSGGVRSILVAAGVLLVILLAAAVAYLAGRRGSGTYVARLAASPAPEPPASACHRNVARGTKWNVVRCAICRNRSQS